MIAQVIEASLRNRGFVVLVAGIAAVLGLWAVRHTPVDAIPDLSDVQVIVYTEFPGQSPEVVDDQVTYPLSTALLSVPHARDVRGYSFFGFSMVYVIFDDDTDLYWARSRVLEYLNVVQGRLPPGVTPQLGPDATGVGWVFQYTLTDFTQRAEVLRGHLDVNGDHRVEEAELPEPDDGDVYTDATLRRVLHADPPPSKSASAEAWTDEAVAYLRQGFDRDRDQRISMQELGRAANFRGVGLDELRSLQDWYLRYDLMSLQGVAEVASVGGFVRQYQVEVDPEKLRAFGVSLKAVRQAIRNANLDAGGRLVEMAETEFMVRGQGYLTSIEDLETIPVGVMGSAHVPVLLSQVARVQLGPEARRGLVDMNGEGEVVSGIVVMRFGENARAVIERVKTRLAELRPGLPEGVEIHVSYDRSELIDAAVGTLQRKLVEEMIVVVLVCLVFLLHLRSALVAVVTVPLGVLLSFAAMKAMGLNANIMSLGGIAIAVGVMVDASVVMVENLHKHRERHPDRPLQQTVLQASTEVGPALFFSLLVVTVSFLPVFALEQQEGRLFGPLAFTKTFAMLFSSILAVTLVPVLMLGLVRGPVRREADNPVARFFVRAYRPVIDAVLHRPVAVVVGALVVALLTLWPYSRLGTEFMPPLNEGDLLYMPTTPPGVSITQARDLLQKTDRIIAQHPQVRHVLGKIGRAETATDPAPLSMIETTILLTPKHSWPRGKQIEDVIAELDEMVQLPGVTNAWTMPIKTRIDMLATGIKTPVGIKLLGDDLAELSKVGAQIEGVLRGVEGTASVYSERVVGGNYIDIRVRRADAARYGLNVGDVQDVVLSAIGGMNVTQTVEGLERYPVNVRYPRELRHDLDALRAVAVHSPMGHTVPLGQVADVEIRKGPPAIKSENARRTAWIFVDLSTSDIGGYVERARAVVDRQVARPEGVSLQWSGQYAYLQRANERLALVVPLTLAIIVVLLYLHFRRMGQTLMVLVGTLVFAPIGGVWCMYLAGFNLSVAAGVGFIALAGLAAETGVVMLVYLDEAVARFARQGRLGTMAQLREAIREGAVDRVRPKLMTVATTTLGLMPVMLGTETGTRIMKRIAAPMVGGLVSSTLLTLVVIPAIYLLWKGSSVVEGRRDDKDTPRGV
ncbi:MAG: CusA/CzcA family heavy metal efflux RND transporter [Myxococcales bacterium]|nr:CusA/CzcA family heavy metal efflux RND transporter [Myxococcales bacterium]